MIHFDSNDGDGWEITPPNTRVVCSIAVAAQPIGDTYQQIVLIPVIDGSFN